MIDGEWHLVTDRGQIRKESPILGTWDAAMAIHDLVQEQLRHKTFVIPVLVLTDMEPDAEAELVLPGSTRAVRTTEPLAAPAHQVHIHVEHLHIRVEHLHIHVAGPEGLTDLQEAPH